MPVSEHCLQVQVNQHGMGTHAALVYFHVEPQIWTVTTTSNNPQLAGHQKRNDATAHTVRRKQRRMSVIKHMDRYVLALSLLSPDETCLRRGALRRQFIFISTGLDQFEDYKGQVQISMGVGRYDKSLRTIYYK